jgi:uncharacterized membrane protein
MYVLIIRENILKKITLKDITITGICAAIIFVVTFLIKVPVPVTSTGAYINLGDTVIYVVAFLLNPILAMLAAGIGSFLADLAGGYGAYMFATLVIKAMMGLCCSLIAKKENFVSFVVACVIGGVIMVFGYGAFEWLVFGWTVAIANMPYNLIQFAGGIIIALVFFKALPRLKRELYR